MLSSPGSQTSGSPPTARGSFGLTLRIRGRARRLAAAMPLCLLVTLWPAALGTHSAQAKTKPRHGSHRVRHSAHRFRHRSQHSRHTTPRAPRHSCGSVGRHHVGRHHSGHTRHIRAQHTRAQRGARCERASSRVASKRSRVPTTIITSGPAPGSTSTSSTARFGFSSNEPSSTFRCSLDGAAYGACTSPATYSGLVNAVHTFRVFATANNANGPVASVTWTVAVPPPAKEEPKPPPSTSGAGLVKYRLGAGSYFDPYSGETAWIKAHIPRTLGYEPFADRYTSIVPTLSYHDGYTTWGPHSLNPTHRAEWVAWVKRDHEHGYAGTFLDDFEAEGSGQHELGSNAELQALIEAIRAAIPNDVIEINMQPQDLCSHLGQPWLKRVLSLVDQEDIELGPYSFLPWTQLISCIQALHSKGVHVDLVHATQGDAYSLATYLLINTGQDYIGAHMTPPEWTGYFDRDLGEATSGIQVSGSTYTRHFTRGVVSVNTSTKTGSVTG